MTGYAVRVFDSISQGRLGRKQTHGYELFPYFYPIFMWVQQIIAQNIH